MPDFTPGPWTVSRMTNSYFVLAVHGPHLARMYRRAINPNHQHDANLMAAAPDLYAALAAVLRAYNGPTVDAANAVSGCMDAARAALAKAEGRDA